MSVYFIKSHPPHIYTYIFIRHQSKDKNVTNAWH